MPDENPSKDPDKDPTDDDTPVWTEPPNGPGKANPRGSLKPADDTGDSHYIEHIIYVKLSFNPKTSSRAFQVIVVVGNGDGVIGLGRALSKPKVDAVREAKKNARERIFPVARRGTTIPRTYHVARRGIPGNVALYPAPRGTGIKPYPGTTTANLQNGAEDAIRAVLECAGIYDIYFRVARNTSVISAARLTVAALKGTISEKNPSHRVPMSNESWIW